MALLFTSVKLALLEISGWHLYSISSSREVIPSGYWESLMFMHTHPCVTTGKDSIQSCYWKLVLKQCVRFENTPHRIPPSSITEFLLWQVHRHGSQKSREQNLVTLTFDLWPRYPSTGHPCQNSSLYVRLFSGESETDGQIHRQTDDAKTITSITSETWGVKIYTCHMLTSVNLFC